MENTMQVFDFAFRTTRTGRRLRFISVTICICVLTFYIYGYWSFKEDTLKQKESLATTLRVKDTSRFITTTIATKVHEQQNNNSYGSQNEMQYPQATDTTTTTKSDTKNTPVLLVTYLRSGSTLTADIIEQSNDVFYVYEPLHSFPQQIYYTDTQICNISTGDCRHPENELEDPNVIKMNLFNILTCQFGNLTQRIYFDMRFHAKRSKAMNQYDKCRNNETNDICIEQLEKLCHQKPIKSVKEIRITMEIANWLMGVIPNLKIIHLLRDPRGMLASQKSGHFIIDNAPTVAKAACNRFQRDVLVTHKMSKIYPGRIKLIVYEEIAENPVQTLNKLYDFLGLTVSQNITNYVLNITRSGKENNGYYNVVRSDSVKTAYKWRSNLNWQTVQQIDTECKEFYELTGFKAFENELNYQDTSFKTRDDTVY